MNRRSASCQTIPASRCWSPPRRSRCRPIVLQRVLMFLDPAIGESVQRVFDLAALYERMSADAAHKIVDSLRGREPVRARRPAHRPMYYDDEATRGRPRIGVRGAPAAAEPQAPARAEPGKRQRTM